MSINHCRNICIHSAASQNARNHNYMYSDIQCEFADERPKIPWQSKIAKKNLYTSKNCWHQWKNDAVTFRMQVKENMGKTIIYVGVRQLLSFLWEAASLWEVRPVFQAIAGPSCLTRITPTFPDATRQCDARRLGNMRKMNFCTRNSITTTL